MTQPLSLLASGCPPPALSLSPAFHSQPPHLLQEADAARAYDRALVRLRGRGAATNFALSDYRTEMADYHQMQSRTLKADER